MSAVGVRVVTAEDGDEARVGVEPPLTVGDAGGEPHPADECSSEVITEEPDPPPAPPMPPANGPAMIRTPHPLPPVPDLGEL
jgi:hypothetical protein